MEITSIVIGILSAVTTFSIGYSVMGVFRINRKMEDVLGYIDNLKRTHESSEHEIHRRISEEIHDTNQTFRDVEVDLRSQLDSRLDKLTNQIIKMIPPTNDELMNRIKNIEEQSHRLRMNM